MSHAKISKKKGKGKILERTTHVRPKHVKTLLLPFICLAFYNPMGLRMVDDCPLWQFWGAGGGVTVPCYDLIFFGMV